MRRYSIRGRIAFIGITAIGLAALRNANNLWVAMMLLLALTAVGVAILGAINLRGRGRAWWLGYALFSGAYLAFSFAPGLSDAFRPQLGTTYLIGYLRDRMFASGVPATDVAEAEQLLAQERGLETELANIRRLSRDVETDPTARKLMKRFELIQGQLNRNRITGPIYEDFHRVGHILCALLAGLVGGAVGVWFHAPRERSAGGVPTLRSEAPRV
jgi:hypothetical protein